MTGVLSDRETLDLRLARDDQWEYGVEAALVRETRENKRSVRELWLERHSCFVSVRSMEERGIGVKRWNGAPEDLSERM